jgi:hypothetical protein
MPPRKKSNLPALKESYDERSLYNWMDIRTEFIEGVKDNDGTEVWPTTKELAERHGVPEKALQNRIARERWKEYRSAHQNQVALERQRERAKVLAGKAVKFDEATVNVAEFGLDLIVRRFAELESLDPVIKANRDLILAAAEIDSKPFRVSDIKASAFSGSELESLSKAAALFVEIGRKGLGIKDGEPATTVQNIQVNQTTNISQELLRRDGDRMKEIFRVLGNKNLSIPSGDEPKEIVEAEVIEEEETNESDS